MTEKINSFEIDSHKLMYHPERVSQWKNNYDCAPIYVEIGPTNVCNHRCVFCALDWVNRDATYIDKDTMMDNLEDMAKLGVKSIMFAGEGEPLLHKNIADFVKQAKTNGIDVAITTNGVVFDPKLAEKVLPYLSWIRFSVDAGTKQTHAKIHGTHASDFDRLVSNIESTANIIRTNNYDATFGVQMLLLNQNKAEAETLTKMAKQYGVHNIQIKPYSHHDKSSNDFEVNYNELTELEKVLLKHSDENFKVIYRTTSMNRLDIQREYTSCHGLNFFALLDAKGNVIPCNLFYENPDFYYGNINEQKFSEIWKSNDKEKIMQKINENGVSECRASCRLDKINMYLDRLKNPLPHDNFI